MHTQQSQVIWQVKEVAEFKQLCFDSWQVQWSAGKTFQQSNQSSLPEFLSLFVNNFDCAIGKKEQGVSAFQVCCGYGIVRLHAKT
jgi:hypothetical protein